MPNHVLYAVVCFFFAVVALFLYREKMKFDPPAGRLRWAWRLAHFGAAALFATAGLFFVIGGNPANNPLVALSLGSVLLLAVLAVAAGFVILLTAPKQ